MSESALKMSRKPLWHRVKNRAAGGASGNVFRGMATLALGSGMGRIIGVAAIPVLTRLYSPQDFGVLAVYAALVSLLAPLVTLRYPLAIPLPRRDGTAMNILVFSICLMIGLSLAISLLLWLVGTPLLTLMSMEALAPWWWLIGIGVITTAGYELLTLWATRRRAYRVIATTNVTQNLVGAAVKIGLGLLAFNPAGLLIGQVFAQGGGIGTLLRSFKNQFVENWQQVRISRLRQVAWKFRGFPIYRVPSQFLMLFSVQAPILFFSVLYDAETTGQLGLALMALALPVSLLGQTTANAFYAEASQLGARQPRAVKNMLLSVMKRLGLLALAPALVLFFAGELLFPLLFGAHWQMAGSFAASLAVYIFFQFLQTPVAHVFYIFNFQRALLALNVQRTIFIVAVFALSDWAGWQAELTIWVYALTLSLHYALSIFYTLNSIPKEDEI